MQSSATDPSQAEANAMPLASLARFYQRAPACCLPDAPVRRALETMRRLTIGSMIVVDAEQAPLGIFTLRDVLDRVALEPGTLDAPIGRLMTTPPVTLDRRSTTYEAALAMIRHGVRHVILIDGSRVAGIVSERDLFGLQSTGVRYLSTAIKGAQNLPEVEAYGRDVGALTRQMVARGAAIGPLTAFISSLIDLLTERIVELEFAANGIDPATVCWIVLGSEGRSEQTLATDQDNGLIFAVHDQSGIEDQRKGLAQICARINRALDRAGFRLCVGNIMAGNPQWCLSLDEWRNRFTRWIDSGSPEALLHGSIFFDLRPLAGNLQLGATLRAWLLELAPKNRRFLHQMATNALESRPALGFFGQLSTDKDGTIDLKLHGARPFVDAARIFSLSCGLAETRTETRLRKAGAALGIAGSETEAWIAAFYHVQSQRLRRQVACLDMGIACDNKLDTLGLHDYDRVCLRAAFEQSRSLQKRLALDFGVA